MNTTTTEALIVETSRGPSLAGTRITVYSVMDYIKAGRSKYYIGQIMELTREQVDAVFDYVEAHRESVEAEYAHILQREAVARAESEKVLRERMPHLFEMSPEELRQHLIQKLAAKKQAAREQNGNHNLAG
jgi:uncharacterized protein (DUF433 family)